jgi:2-phosphoglycerate kinase
MRSAESALRQPEPIPRRRYRWFGWAFGEAPRVVLLGGAPRSGKSSAARRLAERLGYDTVCIDDLVAAVQPVTTVASHQTMTRIDHREYYIQNTV